MWGRFQRHLLEPSSVGDITHFAIAQRVVSPTVTQMAAFWASSQALSRFLGTVALQEDSVKAPSNNYNSSLFFVKMLKNTRFWT
jgi:hypothetical protein